MHVRQHRNRVRKEHPPSLFRVEACYDGFDTAESREKHAGVDFGQARSEALPQALDR